MTPVVERRESPYLADYDAFVRRQSAGTPDWLQRLRRRAIDEFAHAGFPTTRDEEWRFTNVSPIAGARFVPAGIAARTVSKADVAHLVFDESAASTLVFVNGAFAPECSSTGGLPEGVRAVSLAKLLATDPRLVEPYLGRQARTQQAFAALNTAFVHDGLFISVPAGVVVETPIHVVFLSTGTSAAVVSHPRVLAVVGAHGKATLVETYASLGNEQGFTNAVTEIVLGPAAVVDHYKVQRESVRVHHMASMHVHGQGGTTFSSLNVAMGGAIVRNEIVGLLDGEGQDFTLNGAYFADGEQLVDNHTTIDHMRPHCGSHELYKGVLAGRAKAVFNGKIIVRPGAQKTDAKQTNKALLLSDDATINTKPQLEIFADDVKCTHGAAVGQLDDDALFYLRSRGIGVREARNLLVRAFLGDVLERIKIPSLRERVEDDVYARMPDVQKALGSGL